MERLCYAIGLPVLTIDSGSHIGEVQDFVLDFGNTKIKAIVISNDSWFGSDRLIYYEDIFSIGRNAVMVKNAEVIIDVDLNEFINKHDYYCYSYLIDKQIITETGLLVGTLTDIFYNASTGEIAEYQLSDGLITDLLYGRMIMPFPPAQVVSNNKLIVPEIMSTLLQSGKEY